MALGVYHKKRNFKKTKEPRGRVLKTESHRFVIQKHHASHLHYDLRLEMEGVLKSWAVPKGPSLDPTIKRLAMEVEDHPIEYGTFEGLIPEHEYGAGSVIVWDNGDYISDGDASAGYKKGHLDFELKGKKLKGQWSLIRTRSMQPGKTSWLLMKKKDKFAKLESEFNVTEQKQKSVLSNLTIAKLDEQREKSAKESKPRARARSAKLNVKGPPDFIEPQLASLVTSPPGGDDWIHEIKFDGYRTLTRIDHGQVVMFTRSGLDWTDKYQQVADKLKGMPVMNAWIDGEIVVLDHEHVSRFSELQKALKSKRDDKFIYYVFDLMFLDGEDWCDRPQIERKEKLKELLETLDAVQVRYSDHIQGEAQEFLQKSCAHHLEGIISKAAAGPYTSGRGATWTKAKCSKRQEVVIGGYTDPRGTREGFGALLVGAHNDSGDFQYIGRVGTGFDHTLLSDLMKRFKKLASSKNPFEAGEPDERNVHWLKPMLVAEVEFSEWTHDQILRQPSFQGLREDKPANEVVIEKALGSMVKASAKSTRVVRNFHRSKKQVDNETVFGVTITNGEKVLYPDDLITKADIARYYEKTHQWIMPHLKNRPLMLFRCPNGISGNCFYQKHATATKLAGIKPVKIEESDGVREYLTVVSKEGLIELTQMGDLEMHGWQSRAPDVDSPDQMVFDLDPDDRVAWKTVVQCAYALKDILDRLHLKSFVNLTGGKGIHIHVPIEKAYSFDDIKVFSQTIAKGLEEEMPELIISKATKSRRVGKIFVDYLRNGRGATAIIPYSLRARRGAPAAMPVSWSELSKYKPNMFTPAKAIEFLAKRRKDPWSDFFKVHQRVRLLDEAHRASQSRAKSKTTRKKAAIVQKEDAQMA